MDDPCEEKAREALRRAADSRREGRLDEARDAYRSAADGFRALGRGGELVQAMCGQARIERDAGRLDLALALQEDALVAARRLDDARQLAHVLRHLGEILDACGRPTESELYFVEMLRLYRSFDGVPPLEMANVIRSMADHREKTGNKTEAIALWRDARQRYAALDTLFAELTGKTFNPGTAEADRRLARLLRET